jgi:RHS repeat-associated protein
LQPINIGVGNKFLQERDIQPTQGGLEFTRYYNSQDLRDHGALGIGWQHNFNQRLLVAAIAGTSFSGGATAYRPDGRVIRFARTVGSSTWVPDVDVTDRMSDVVDGSGVTIGYQLVDGRSDRVESYDLNGVLTAVDDPRAGLSFSLSLDSQGRLFAVTDRSGRRIQFGYDSHSRITDVWGPDSDAGNPASPHWVYTYDAPLDRLASATDPTGASRIYAYEKSGRPYALTGITDENGIRYVSYGYDTLGRASGENLWAGPSQTLPVGQYALTFQTNNLTHVVDPLGKARDYQFKIVQGVAVLDNVTAPCVLCGGPGATKSRTYDATTGFTNLVTDFNGNVTDYDYDSRGLEAKRVDASNDASPPASSAKRTTETSWNASFRVPEQRSVKNASGTVESLTKWVNNTRGQATARCQIDPAVSGASTYTCGSSTNAPAGVRQSLTTYCESGDVTAGTCPLVGLVTSLNGARLTSDSGMSSLDDTTTYTYYAADDSTCATGGACAYRKGDLWKVTNALSQVTENVSYDKNGRVTRIKDTNGTYTDFSYHPRGWLTDRILRASATGAPGAGDATLHMDYDAVGNVTKVTQPDGAYLQYTYDAAHRLLKINDNLSNAIDYCSGGVGSADCLDAAGNRKVEQIKDPSNAVKRQLHRVYNQLGQLTQVLNATNAAVDTSVGITATGVADGYDGNGNRVLKDDGLGFRTKQDYDPLNRLKDTIQNYGGVDVATQNTTTQYVYDSRDNLRTVTDPDNLATNYTYDGLSNLTNLSSPDTGNTAYTYDLAGNRTSQTDNRGITSTYTYDALNRLVGIAYPTTSLNVSYAYDQPDGTTGCSGSSPVGRLTSMTDSTGSTTYCYDRHGNVTKKTQVTSGTTLVTAYTYTVADRLATMTYPSGAVVTYTRDVLGRVQSVAWQASAGGTLIPLVSSATYYPFGPLNVLAFGNGRTLTKTYDQDYAIDSISGTPAGALTLDLGVDVMGDITSASESIAPPTADRVYQYDPLYRLTTAQTGAASPLEGYTYNKTGDRQSASLNGGTAQPYVYAGGSHRLASVAGTTRTYDANGNTQTGTAAGLTLGYDDRNRLVTAAQGAMNASYSISGRGERVAKTVTVSGTPTTTLYSYDESGHTTGEYGGAGAALNEYIYFDGTPVGLVQGGALYYIETDHLGTPRQVIDRTRNVAIWRWDLLGNTFGATAPNQDPDLDGTPFVFDQRFPGQIADAETNLSYNYYRDYESAVGRYVESDPEGLRAGMETFNYADSVPLLKIDPSGERSLPLENTCESCHAVTTPPPSPPQIPSTSQLKIALAAVTYTLADPIIRVCLDNFYQCPPCEPYAVGTIGYQGPEVGVRGRDAGVAHYWLYQVEQIPVTCKCFWKEKTKSLTGSHHNL